MKKLSYRNENYLCMRCKELFEGKPVRSDDGDDDIEVPTMYFDGHMIDKYTLNKLSGNKCSWVQEGQSYELNGKINLGYGGVEHKCKDGGLSFGIPIGYSPEYLVDDDLDELVEIKKLRESSLKDFRGFGIHLKSQILTLSDDLWAHRWGLSVKQAKNRLDKLREAIQQGQLSEK